MIKALPGSEGPVLGFEISGKVSVEEERKWIQCLDSALEDYDKLNILLLLDPGAGWGLNSGVEDLKWVMSHIKVFNRLAVVSSSEVWKWLIKADSYFASFAGVDEKHFDSSEIDIAWRWITEQ